MKMHTPAPDAEPGPHDPDRVIPPAPVPPEMEPLIPALDPDNPLELPRDAPDRQVKVKVLPQLQRGAI